MVTTRRRIRRILLAGLLSLGLLVIMVGTASAQTAQRTFPAHASVLNAIPAIGSTIAQAPTKVTVFTAENINPDPKKSNLFVYGPGGEATSKLISQGNDATVSLTNPKEMSVTITPDPKHSDGVYVVHWMTVSAVDGDRDEGAFVFTVKAGTSATPTPAKAVTTSPTTTTGASGTPLWVPFVVGVLALLIGLGGGLALGRRTAASSVSAMRSTIAQQQEKEAQTKQPQ